MTKTTDGEKLIVQALESIGKLIYLQTKFTHTFIGAARWSKTGDEILEKMDLQTVLLYQLKLAAYEEEKAT